MTPVLVLHEPAIVNGMLIVIAVTTLTFAYRNLRHYLRRPGTRPAAGGRFLVPPPRRPVAASGPVAATAPRAGATPWVSPPPRTVAAAPMHADAPVHAEDYPSWPGRPGPSALHPDHPSWPGRPDPRWTAFEEAWADDGPG